MRTACDPAHACSSPRPASPCAVGYGRIVRQTLSPRDFVEAALAIVDESGLAELNTRVLGERLGVHSTAVYRHFRDWDSLLMALADAQLGRMAQAQLPLVAQAPSPRAALAMLAMTVRQAAVAKPEFARLLLGILEADSVVPTPNADRITMIVLEQLRLMGLEGEALVTAHQAYESCLVGSVLFDFMGEPHHLANRQVRRRVLPVAEFTVSAATPEAVGECNERAFAFALDTLLDGIERLAAR